MSKKKLLFLIGLLILALILLLLLIFKRGAGQDGLVEKVGDLMVTTQETTGETGEVISVSVDFRTGNENEVFPISSLSFRLVYDYPGDEPDIVLVDKDGEITNKIFPYEKIANSDEWSFPVNRVVDADGKLQIDFAAVNTSTDGFLNQAYMPVATIYFLANKVPADNAFKLEFDLGSTKMMTKKSPPQDILNVPGNLNFTISN